MQSHDQMLSEVLHIAMMIIITIQKNKKGNTILQWNDIGCSGSPGPEGCTGNGCNTPTCNPSAVRSVYVPPECADTQGCNWCNCNVDDVGFIDFLAGVIEQTYCIDTTREYALGNILYIFCVLFPSFCTCR